MYGMVVSVPFCFVLRKNESGCVSAFTFFPRSVAILLVERGREKHLSGLLSV